MHTPYAALIGLQDGICERQLCWVGVAVAPRSQRAWAQGRLNGAQPAAWDRPWRSPAGSWPAESLSLQPLRSTIESTNWSTSSSALIAVIMLTINKISCLVM